MLVSSFLACSHCSNWSSTISTFWPGETLAAAQGRERLFKTQIGRQTGTALAQAVQNARLGFERRGFDVDRDHFRRQSRQQAGLDQRRFAASRWAIDQAHGEGVVRILFLDPRFAETNAVRQAVPIARPRQQFDEEIRIVGIKRAQALRQNLEGLLDANTATGCPARSRGFGSASLLAAASSQSPAAA